MLFGLPNNRYKSCNMSALKMFGTQVVGGSIELNMAQHFLVVGPNFQQNLGVEQSSGA